MGWENPSVMDKLFPVKVARNPTPPIFSSFVNPVSEPSTIFDKISGTFHAETVAACCRPAGPKSDAFFGPGRKTRRQRAAQLTQRTRHADQRPLNGDFDFI